MTSVYSAPAKLNFGLRVLGRREDGYHVLESVFVPIELGDEVEIDFDGLSPAGVGASSPAPDELQVDFEAVCDDGLPGSKELGSPGDNLAVRAARAYLALAGLSGRVGIRLRKSIPVGAGLGGGSSDAGAVLRALSRAFPGRVSDEKQLDLATGLGADVPFFLRPAPSLIGGIGEEITPLDGLPEVWLLLVNPGVSLVTAEVFAAYDRVAPALTLDPSRYTMRSLEEPGAALRATEPLRAILNASTHPRSTSSLHTGLDQGVEDPVSELDVDRAPFENDLEASAIKLCPQIAGLQDRVRELGARHTAMSGSGATIYGIFENHDAACSALERANFEGPIWASVTRTLGESID